MKVAVCLVLSFFMVFAGCAHKTFNITQPHTTSVPQQLAASPPKSDKPSITIPLELLTIGIADKPTPKKCKVSDGKHCTAVTKIDGEIDETTAVLFLDWLESWKAEKGVKNLFIEIDSPGGNVFEGFKMYHALREFKAENKVKVHCAVNGMGASMAFFMLQACDTRSMTRTSVLLAHTASFTLTRGVQLNLNKLVELANDLSGINEVMATVISERMKMPIEMYKEKVNGKNWQMNYRMALNYNAVDFITPTVYEYIKALKETNRPPKKIRP